MKWGIKVLFGALFAVFALLVMFSDAQYHIGYETKPSMALTHGAHGGGHDTPGSNDHGGGHDAPADDSGGHDDHGGAAAEGKHGHISSFGPGEAPHFHAFDLSTLERVDDIARHPDDLPPPINRNQPTTVSLSLTAKEVVAEIAEDITYHYWTFDGKIPGPLLRVREGDTVELTLANDPTSTHDHSIDLHAVTGPGGGATLTQVKPGESKTIRFKALNSGVYVYHCATANVPMHMTNGMYGLIIVEPKEGFPSVDKEFYIMQGELYTGGPVGETGFQEFDPGKMMSEDPEYVIFNGRVKSLVDNPLQASVGDTVRLYVGNGGVSLVSSFHVIGEIFDTVYPEASMSPLRKNTQTTLVPAGGATVTEFLLDTPGNFILVDHALSRLDRGAWGVLNAAGEERPDIYTAVNQ